MGSPPETKQEHRTLILEDGTEIPVRTIRPGDASALQRFHGRLSERSIYLRFFGSIKELSDEKARYFTHTDGIDHFALGALDPDELDDFIALVRYDREPGSERAEYAALVEDRWQGHGVGIDLTRRLVDEARDKEVRFFYAMVMGKNKRMLELLRHLDLPEHERREAGVKHVEVELGPKAS